MIDERRRFAKLLDYMTKRTRNLIFALLILSFPFCVLIGFLLYDLPTVPPPKPLPSPNGYNDFVQAAGMLASNSSDYYEMNQEQLQTLVENNSNALQLARAGLEQQSRVPLQFTQAYSKSHLPELANLKRLAQAFVAEGKLAEMENRPADAAKSYLDVIHLGVESAQGGVLIDGLVGIAIEAIGTDSLQKLAPRLDAQSCREAASDLENFIAQQQTWDETMQQEHDWSRRTFPGLKNEWVRIMTGSSQKKIYHKTEQKFKTQQMKTEELMVDLATRAYTLEKGQPPLGFSDLVPDYLKSTPQDPLTGTNMVYSPNKL